MKTISSTRNGRVSPISTLTVGDAIVPKALPSTRPQHTAAEAILPSARRLTPRCLLIVVWVLMLTLTTFKMVVTFAATFDTEATGPMKGSTSSGLNVLWRSGQGLLAGMCTWAWTKAAPSSVPSNSSAVDNRRCVIILINNITTNYITNNNYITNHNYHGTSFTTDPSAFMSETPPATPSVDANTTATPEIALFNKTADERATQVHTRTDTPPAASAWAPKAMLDPYAPLPTAALVRWPSLFSHITWPLTALHARLTQPSSKRHTHKAPCAPSSPFQPMAMLDPYAPLPTAALLRWSPSLLQSITRPFHMLRSLISHRPTNSTNATSSSFQPMAMLDDFAPLPSAAILRYSSLKPLLASLFRRISSHTNQVASPSFLASAWWSLHDARRLHAGSYTTFNKNFNKSGNATSIDLRHVMQHAKGWGHSIQASAAGLATALLSTADPEVSLMVADKRAGIITLPYLYTYKRHGEMEEKDVEDTRTEEEGDVVMRTAVQRQAEDTATVGGADGVKMHDLDMTEEELLYVKLDELAEGVARRLQHWGQRAQAGVGWWARALLSTPDPEVALMIDERKLMASSSPSSSSVFVGAEERPKASGYGAIVASTRAPRVQVMLQVAEADVLNRSQPASPSLFSAGHDSTSGLAAVRLRAPLTTTRSPPSLSAPLRLVA